MRLVGRGAVSARFWLLLGILGTCVPACDGLEPTEASPPVDEEPAEAGVVKAAMQPLPECHNDAIPPTSTTLVIAPHPDDETLGFAGPIYAATRAGRRVRVVIATDGQAYCGACEVWKNGAPRDDGERAAPCTLQELVVFGHVRRRETLAAMDLLGVGAHDVTFLGYVDGSLPGAWLRPEQSPALPSCVEDETPPAVWSKKTGTNLAAELAAIVREESEARVVFTTDPRDTHPDHATLHAFVVRALTEAGGERHLFTALIHRSNPDACLEADRRRSCGLPQRGAHDTEEVGFREMRERSYAPTSFWEAREDEFGPPLRYCLPPALVEGRQPLKRRAIERYETQIGVSDRLGKPLPDAYQGWVDWAGWLLGFVRRDELFYGPMSFPLPKSPEPEPGPAPSS